MIEIDQSKIVEIQSRLLEWFQTNGRSFPWRETQDPYKILLVEKLLQQTSVRADLIQAYRELLIAFPTVEKLAQANIGDVQKIILPLGLLYRAKEIIGLAQEIIARYNGNIPPDFQSLMGLPGIGDYSARAILCFAFGEEVAIVDINVARILFRVFSLPGKFPANPARKKFLLELATLLIPRYKARDFNLAVLDLGALICKSINPSCLTCPILPTCNFGQNVKKVN